MIIWQKEREATYQELEKFVEMVTTQDPKTICPFCDEAWSIERQEDLCDCQFAKRRLIREDTTTESIRVLGS